MKTIWQTVVWLLSISAVCLVMPVSADDDMETVRAAIARNVATVRPDWKISIVRPIAVEGLYEVHFEGGILLYMTADGRHVFDGELYEIGNGKQVSLTEQVRKAMRVERLVTLKREDMIVFSPQPPQAVKAAVYVFTDVDCGYCQLLHQEVPQLNSMGIEVRYLAWPRAGFESETYRKMVTAWCARDRQTVLTRMKNREPVPISLCDKNPIADQFLLGQEMGIRGTPALVFENGELQPGYVPAAQLVPMLLNAAKLRK